MTTSDRSYFADLFVLLISNLIWSDHGVGQILLILKFTTYIATLTFYCLRSTSFVPNFLLRYSMDSINSPKIRCIVLLTNWPIEKSVLYRVSCTAAGAWQDLLAQSIVIHLSSIIHSSSEKGFSTFCSTLYIIVFRGVEKRGHEGPGAPPH